MEIREVRRRKRRMHLIAIGVLLAGLFVMIIANLGLLMTSDIIANSRPEVVAIEPGLLDENDPEILPEKPKESEVRGTIYLTFDDGPSEHTAGLLDVLKKYDVKATFFVTRNGDDAVLKREFDEGHAVGLHSYSHNYSIIYSNTDAFWTDFNKISERVERVTGEKTMLFRFPGGSSNTVSRRYDSGKKIMSKLVTEATDKGYQYFDWNIDSDDAGAARDADAVYNNIINNLKDGDNLILQHDTKSYSVEAVERVIRYGFEHGFKFEKLSFDGPSAHHGINN